jgi:hypothetical protein
VCAAFAAAGTTPEGLAFLAENGQKEGWTVLESGLQYKVLASGPRPGPSPLASTGALRYRLDLPVMVMPTCCARQTTASFTAWRASPRLAPMTMYATVFTFPPSLPD